MTRIRPIESGIERRGRGRPRPRVAASALAVATALAVTAIGAAAVSAEAAERTVVVELFTSQGCSSCPPADRLLSAIDSDGTDGGVIPLAFHVDYWDGIGWPDPFASPAFSARQRAYAGAWGSARVYTPQLVVDGAIDAVGSDRRRVEAAIASARRTPARARVTVAASRVGGALAIAAAAEMLEAVREDAGAVELLVAVVDGGHRTEVGAGENARRTLRNDHVVRRLERVGRLVGAAGKAAGSLEIELEPSWNRDTLAVVALLQARDSREILGAARARPETE